MRERHAKRDGVVSRLASFTRNGELARRLDDDNDNVKKAIGFVSKTLRPMHDYHVKLSLPNASFYGGCEHNRMNFPFSF